VEYPFKKVKKQQMEKKTNGIEAQWNPKTCSAKTITLILEGNKQSSGTQKCFLGEAALTFQSTKFK